MTVFEKKEPTQITSLSDKRLVKIDPQVEGFYDNILNFKTSDKKIKLFISEVRKLRNGKIEAFYKPIYDPTDAEEENMVLYYSGTKPAIGHSFNWWCETAKKMPLVEGRKWHLATVHQYYVLLTYLVNALIEQKKITVEEALNLVVNDSTSLGHYCNSENSTKGEGFEKTGSRCICGLYDLANTYKILKSSNTFCIAGGFYYSEGYCLPLAYMCHDIIFDVGLYGVGILIL